MSISNETSFRASIWGRFLILLAFLISVNLLAGFVAVMLGYESLYNVKASFAEYALPLPFFWGLLHMPSMLIYGIPLVLLPGLQKKYVGYFRAFCAVSFVLLLLELDKKIPFLLFPKIDALTALVFSLFVVPPNRKDNPLLVAASMLSVALGILVLGYFGFSYWTHRTPTIANTQYGVGVFELKSISVMNDYHKSMDFAVDLKRRLPTDQICALAQTLAVELLRDYPFDDTYRKEIAVTLNPSTREPDLIQYVMGIVDLNDRTREKDGRYYCYMTYRPDAAQ